jgi:AcrR family transcriptional regulator
MAVARNGRRPYRQKLRAEHQAQTRQRIVESAVALHLERGPAQTSINAIAERAGVNRVTVYRHFPDARALLEACSLHARRLNPPPDLEAWRRIEDPRRRLEVGLGQLYDYFRRTESGWANVLRDAELAPLVKEMAEERRLAHLREARDVLLSGWHVRGPRRRLLGAVIGLAVDFRTWQTLARGEGLDDRTAAALMGHLAASVGRSRPDSETGGALASAARMSDGRPVR